MQAAARRCANECSREELAAFAHTWRNGTDLMTQVLANELSYELGRSMGILRRFCEVLCQVAIGMSPELAELPWKDQLTRAGTLLGLNRDDDAAEILTKALLQLPEEGRSQAEQLLALATTDYGATTAIDGLTQEIARESEPWQRALLTRLSTTYR
jgi:hypothetical protein